MKVINLVNLEKSEIKYKISKFPDGQQQVKIETFTYIEVPTDKSVQIKSRLNNWLDLELITCTVASLRELGVTEIHLYTPYILGARSDRKFEEGSNNYLKHVICPVINNLKLKSVTCLDPHSNCLEMGINRFRKIDNSSLFREAIRSLYGLAKARTNDNFILISPDAGATHKIYKLAQDVDYKGDIITCSKERDKDGKLTQVNVPYLTKYDEKRDYIIIDDICDGGATFINIAKELKKHVTGKIYLIVTHSIFSKGTEELLKYFDCIYSTNSYKNHELENVKILNVF